MVKIPFSKTNKDKSQRKKVIGKAPSKFQVKKKSRSVHAKKKITLNIGCVVSDRPLSKEEVRRDKKELDAFLRTQTRAQRAFGLNFAKKLCEKMKVSFPKMEYVENKGKVVVQGKVVGSLKGLTSIS